VSRNVIAVNAQSCQFSVDFNGFSFKRIYNALSFNVKRCGLTCYLKILGYVVEEQLVITEQNSVLFSNKSILFASDSALFGIDHH
jgi:hypothetical protein